MDIMPFLERDPQCKALFADLPETVVSDIPVAEIAPDNTIIEMGTYANHIYIILDGICAIVKKSCTSEKPVIISRLGYLDIVGLYEIIRNVNRVGRVITLTPCTMAIIEREQIASWTSQYPQFVRNLSTQISDRHFNRIDYLNYYIKYSTKCALVSFFLEQYRLLSSPFALKKPSIQIFATRAELSEEIGRDIRSVNRCIQELKDQGCITVKKGKIFISKEQVEVLSVLREELSNQ